MSRSRIAAAAVALLLVAPWAAWGGEEPLFRADFESPDALARWEGAGGERVEVPGRGHALRVRSADPEGRPVLLTALPAPRMAGELVTLAATVKAREVTTPPNSWNGIKVMLMLETDHGRLWPQLRLPHGSFDWRRVERTLRIPMAVKKATLVLGLERASGTAWFHGVSLRLARRPPGGRRLERPFKGHGLPRLRGVMHGPKFEEKNVRDLAAWGANQVRWQLNWTPMKKAEEWARDLDRYDAWLEGALEEADRAIEACRRHRILVLLDLHCPPGGRAGGGVCRMFTEERYREKFLALWERLARRYKGREVIYAYDLVNEPVEPPGGGIVSWPHLATEATRRIRAIDPGKPVVFEPGPWGSCDGFDQMVPLDLEGVIYSFHMYQPGAFTHQFRHDEPLVYPGVISGERWDKARLRESMMPAIDFQRDFNVHIYVGEFSAIRWAPEGSARRYLRDCIELFEEQGWDWSYHAFREWHGWSVEHSTEKSETEPSPQPTKREELLREWFARNQRPRF
ncbi:MAG: glycoside hydrolase family 5 protein [Candidatus Brocadiia bacterium]